jgi:hypothetical protein
MRQLSVQAHQRLGKMATGAGWNLIEALLQVPGFDFSFATGGLRLAAPASVALPSACGLHAPLALGAERHCHLLKLGKVEDVDLLQVERTLSHRTVNLQLIARDKSLHNIAKVLGGLESGAF